MGKQVYMVVLRKESMAWLLTANCKTTCHRIADDCHAAVAT